MRCDVAYEVIRLVRERTRSSRTILSSDSSDHTKHHHPNVARARAQHSVTACAQGVQLQRKRRLVEVYVPMLGCSAHIAKEATGK